ncbi:hypothetical protein NC652_004820 [Populus alba x Populus x berolinensis]|nr:hypothetical protein NC652_004820 [Populus alba x Populus x berolinensis]
MVVAWTGLSISTPQQSSLSGVPRRLFSPLPWDTASLHPLDCHQDLCFVDLIGLPPSNGVLPQSPMQILRALLSSKDSPNCRSSIETILS